MVADGPQPGAERMTSQRFEVMGASRSYLDFYLGFGWTIGIEGLMQAMLLWQLASVARTAPRQANRMVATIAIANVVAAVLTWRFFFLVPALFSLALVAVLITAWFAGRDRSSEGASS